MNMNSRQTTYNNTTGHKRDEQNGCKRLEGYLSCQQRSTLAVA